MKRLLIGVSGDLSRQDRRVWILMIGRLLSQLGTGFTLFYAPIFFVNQVGLSATAVGLGLGISSIAGVVGRILGGTWSDSPRIGRRWTLLLSSAVSAIACFLLALTSNFPVFLAGNIFLGFGIGLYWPATEAVVADITTSEQRREAFALTRLADALGLGIGVALGGLLIAVSQAYRSLFIIDGISFLVFFTVIYQSIAETRIPRVSDETTLQGWRMALGDRTLLVFTLVNSLFTTYLALVNSILPLYLTNFVPRQQSIGFSPVILSGLFFWYVGLTALTQMPIARRLNRLSHSHALSISALLWGISFILVWAVGTLPVLNLATAVVSLGTMAIATVAYTPAASAFVAELAPDSLRGIYLAINSLCWAVGYFVGPTIGGWAMDQSEAIAHNFWVAAALSVLGAIGILRLLARHPQEHMRR